MKETIQIEEVFGIYRMSIEFIAGNDFGELCVWNEETKSIEFMEDMNVHEMQNFIDGLQTIVNGFKERIV